MSSGFCGLSLNSISQLIRRPRRRPAPRPLSACTIQSPPIPPRIVGYADLPPKRLQVTAPKRARIVVPVKLSVHSCGTQTATTTKCEHSQTFCSEFDSDDQPSRCTTLPTQSGAHSIYCRKISEVDLTLVAEEKPLLFVEDWNSSTQRAKRLSTESYSLDKFFLCQCGKKTKETVTYPGIGAISTILTYITDRVKCQDLKTITTCALLIGRAPTAH